MKWLLLLIGIERGNTGLKFMMSTIGSLYHEAVRRLIRSAGDSVPTMIQNQRSFVDLKRTSPSICSCLS